MSKKIYLVLNAAEKQIQFIIANDEKLLYQYEYNSPKNGMDSLFSLLAKACEQIEINPNQISHLACVSGPGNFMGIRLTALLTSVFFLCDKENKFQAGLDYLQCLALNIEGKQDEIVKVLTNATKTGVHCADYSYNEHGLPIQITPLRLIDLPKNGKIHDEFNQKPNYILGSGVELLGEHYKNMYPESNLLGNEYNNPSLLSLYKMIKVANWTKQNISPIYLKKCDALENLDAISLKQGQNPEKAHKELDRLMNLYDFSTMM